MTGEGCVDHFIAWSRYPVDLGHNLVLAHNGCNEADRLVRVDASWRDVLRGLPRVAEPPPLDLP